MAREEAGMHEGGECVCVCVRVHAIFVTFFFFNLQEDKDICITSFQKNLAKVCRLSSLRHAFIDRAH